MMKPDSSVFLACVSRVLESRRHWLMVVTALAFALSTLSYAAPAEPANPAQRIVSVGSDITEIVYALGAGDRLVATDTTSVYPIAAKHLPKVGYMRNLATEGVLSLEPDLILLGASAGPASTIDQLTASGIAMKRAPGQYTLESVRQKIKMVGQALNESVKATELLHRFNADVSKLESLQKRLTNRPRVAFLIGATQSSIQAGGRETAAQALLELVRAENVFDHQSYKAVSTESMIALNPAAVVMMTHSVDAAGGVQAIARWPAISLTQAGRNNRVTSVDAAALLAFGPRIAASAAELARQLHRYDASR